MHIMGKITTKAEASTQFTPFLKGVETEDGNLFRFKVLSQDFMNVNTKTITLPNKKAKAGEPLQIEKEVLEVKDGEGNDAILDINAKYVKEGLKLLMEDKEFKYNKHIVNLVKYTARNGQWMCDIDYVNA